MFKSIDPQKINLETPWMQVEDVVAMVQKGRREYDCPVPPWLFLHHDCNKRQRIYLDCNNAVQDVAGGLMNAHETC